MAVFLKFEIIMILTLIVLECVSIGLQLLHPPKQQGRHLRGDVAGEAGEVLEAEVGNDEAGVGVPRPEAGHEAAEVIVQQQGEHQPGLRRDAVPALDRDQGPRTPHHLHQLLRHRDCHNWTGERLEPNQGKYKTNIKTRKELLCVL